MKIVKMSASLIPGYQVVGIKVKGGVFLLLLVSLLFVFVALLLDVDACHASVILSSMVSFVRLPVWMTTKTQRQTMREDTSYKSIHPCESSIHHHQT